MSGHAKWEGGSLRASSRSRAQEVHLAFVDGYILALEDLYKDLRELELEYRHNPELDRNRLGGKQKAVRDIRRIVNLTLSQAKRTMGAIKEESMICHDCRNGRHQECPGNAQCPCQHRTDVPEPRRESEGGGK